MRRNKQRVIVNYIVILAFLLVLLFLRDSTLFGLLNAEVTKSSAAHLQDFVTLFMSIIVEAFPFIVFGVLVSVLVGVFVKSTTLIELLPKNFFLSNLMLSFLGTLLPVCECGNIPVARRLLMKGLSVPQTMTFLLAAPIINPITLYATLEAFSFNENIAFLRILGALVIANVVGFVISKLGKDETHLQAEFIDACELEQEHEHHDHAHTWVEKITDGVSTFINEFFEIMRMLAIGGLIAAATQVFIPREIINGIGEHLVFSVIAMMALAFVISICSNVDAFFALSYVNHFSMGSILSFLVFGPMVDIKILSMLRSTFKARTLFVMTSLVVVMSFSIGLLYNLIERGL